MAGGDQIPYAVSKAAVKQLTAMTALSLAPYGIRVNASGRARGDADGRGGDRRRREG
jgi:NAD(P)-dependent dehydrogenase (short-subunit alcohol dehydrogenase family)